jgi:glutamine amidotransferase
MKVAIIDYGSGDLRSRAKALEREARRNAISARVEVTNNSEAVADADRLVLPASGPSPIAGAVS